MKKTFFKLFSKSYIEGYPIGFFFGIIILLVFGVIVCLFSFIHYTEEENSNIQMDLERASKQIVHNIQMNAMYLLSSIDTLKALYYVNPNFKRKDFNIFLNTTLKNSEFQYLFWVERVKDEERKQFEQDFSFQTKNKFQIFSFNEDTNSIEVANHKKSYYPIVHAFPTLSKDIIGLDINSTNYMKETINKAIINKRPTVHLSRKVILSKRNIDILIINPILSKTTNDTSQFTNPQTPSPPQATSPLISTTIENLTLVKKSNDDECTHISAGLFLIEKNVEASRVEVEQGNDFTLFLSTFEGELVYQESYLNFKTLKEVHDSKLFQDRLKYETSLKVADCVFKLWAFTTEEYENNSKTYLPLLISIISGVILILLVIYLMDQRKQKSLIAKIMREKNNLINKILPLEVSVKLENGEDVVAERSNNACVFFLDIAGFTRFSSIHSPEQVIQVLIKIFNSMDLLCAKHGIEKIKTIGDAYMATCGIFPKSDDIRHNTYRMLEFALDVLESIPKEMSFHLGLQVRVGVHCGPVISGVISGYAKPHFDVWGDTVNVASRMESTGIAGQIHVSDRVYQLGKDDFDFSERCDIIHVKGKGRMKTWYLMGKKESEFTLRKDYSRSRIQPSIFNRKQSHQHCIYPDFPGGIQVLNIENNNLGCENCSKIYKKTYSFSPDNNYYYNGEDTETPIMSFEQIEELNKGVSNKVIRDEDNSHQSITEESELQLKDYENDNSDEEEEEEEFNTNSPKHLNLDAILSNINNTLNNNDNNNDNNNNNNSKINDNIISNNNNNNLDNNNIDNNINNSTNNNNTNNDIKNNFVNNDSKDCLCKSVVHNNDLLEKQKSIKDDKKCNNLIEDKKLAKENCLVPDLNNIEKDKNKNKDKDKKE
ncbi:hypothetical protein DICPUDRAFT_38950 [Dictyostelium purpureum]|uniref:adenylate cyclase n=1 Tax=Dictyostelium purpureum TaxID=5786 RepID=F0ZVG7_DICPU|nr:uncharacterized protein DICPUDRAFT_38950 [Dictyostelium purpureum]EGC32056.1 hypothetical protein DICPUDRAFT_38950 [Dictyostelium purpureum]|eukprot:XP_003291410.1 hypothetical protein DICPUDRAFT_38950 [Dictyostelium purpureum]